MTRPRISPLATLCFLGFASAGTQAATFDLGGDASFSIGAGLRLSYQSVEDAAPSGTDRSNDFVVNSTRVYTSGRVTKTLGATLNFEREGSGNTPDGLRVMDAYVQYEPMPEFNLWFGRMLPASDRANLDGPFYLNVWDYPMVSQYPSLAIGRDNGVQVWGKLMEDKFTYVAGAFKGHNNFTGASNESDNLLYSWRLAYAFWDAEPAPAYYTGSTYYGGKDILTVGFAGMHQQDAIGLAAAPDDYTGMNIDVLMEKKLAAGVLTLEGAYYKYDLGGTPDCGSGEPGSPACPGGTTADDNVGGLVEGKGYLATAAFLFPSKIGIGQMQPFVRYQSFDRKLSDSSVDVIDVGLNYVIKGHNARVSAFWSKTEDDRPTPDSDLDKFVIGVQFQI